MFSGSPHLKHKHTRATGRGITTQVSSLFHFARLRCETPVQQRAPSSLQVGAFCTGLFFFSLFETSQIRCVLSLVDSSLSHASFTWTQTSIFFHNPFQIDLNVPVLEIFITIIWRRIVWQSTWIGMLPWKPSVLMKYQGCILLSKTTSAQQSWLTTAPQSQRLSAKQSCGVPTHFPFPTMILVMAFSTKWAQLLAQLSLWLDWISMACLF